MKKLLFSLVVFSVLFIIGCQENSITDPIQDPVQQELQKTDDPSVLSGTITLEGMLQDPHPVMNSYYIINGEIQYQHTLEFLDPIPPNPQYLVSLNFSVSANFNYLCTVCEPEANEEIVGTISIDTNDIVYLSDVGNNELLRSFLIQGRTDGMVLKCRFVIATDGMELNEMWLEVGDDHPVSNVLNKNIEPDPVTTYPSVAGQQFD